MKIYNKILVFVASIAIFASCNDYLDINSDPNNPLAEVVGPELILPAAQNATVSGVLGNATRLGNIMMNQWAGDVTNFTGGNSNEYRFNITSSFYTAIWTRAYLGTDKLQAVINKDSEENANFAAIGRILKVASMQPIVDIYGDIPYSEAFKRGKNFTPAYDAALDVYKQMFDELTLAISNIDNATINTKNPGNVDVMLGGNMNMWKKFANTLKLKLLVRASSSSNTDAVAFVNDKWPSLANATFLGVGESITNNPGYNAGSGQQNPFWEFYGFSADGTQQQNNKFFVGSEYFIEYLKGSNKVAPLAPSDNRISAFFTTANNSGGDYQGIKQGEDDPANPNIGLSFIGSGLLGSASQKAYLFTASESLFLQAEAAMNGKISGNAKTFFESGINESFTMYGLNGASYVAAINSIPGVGWSGNTTSDLEAIMRQKWIALHSVNGLETYIEHNRTGFPNPPLPTLATQSHRPYRLLYPLSEVTGNAANVPSQSASDVFTPSIFWQQ